MNLIQNQQAQAADRALPAGACDCHAHVYGPFDRFPIDGQASFQPKPAPVQSLEELWGTFGIERGGLIQGSAYGGTDWPHLNIKEPHSDEALFELLAHVAPDERSRTRLLADNPARLYGFPSPV